MIKVYVIAPDIYSGDAFNKVLNKQGIDTEFHFHKIAPRVFENKITTKMDVVNDMNAIFKTFNDKTKSVVIACNTLQLWLDKIDKKYQENVKVYTTFEACEWKFKMNKHKPVWLGTTPLVRETKKFPTLVSLNDETTQELVQELIWRIKMYGDDDIQTAPERVKHDASLSKSYQKTKINKLKLEIISSLKLHGVSSVITGCTELPLVFDKENDSGINFYDPAKILAEYIKSQSVEIIFAGGTISSVANNSGLREGGKAFDLLERLAQSMPGAYKKLNITKSNIVYSGFSENMNLRDRTKLLKAILNILKINVPRIVITHGTDSMEETARFLDSKLKNNLSKTRSTVVLTGSNDHAGSKKTDAWNNLKFAINYKNPKFDSGVFVAFHDRFIPANDVVKEYFDGKEMNYISKKDKKYLIGLKKYNKWKEDKKKIIHDKYFSKDKNIQIIEYSVNQQIKNHGHFLKNIEKNKPDAVLFILYHSSTANVEDRNSSVSDLIVKLTKMSIRCFGITENGEPTDLTKYPSSLKLKKLGLIGL